MAFKIYNNSTQFAQFIVLIVFTPLGVAVTVLRFVATRHGARKPGLEDWMAALATVFFVLVNLAGLLAISILNGRTIEQEIAESPADYRQMRVWDMTGVYLYLGHILTVKLSVLALFYRIFGINRTYRIWIYIIGGFQTMLCIIFCVFQGLQCRPFERYFDKSIPGTCRDDGVVIVGGETPNSFVDFAMVALAMVMIRPRQLPRATKWRLRVLFGFGIIAGTLGFVKIAVTFSLSEIYAFSMVSLWTCVQMFVSLLCCCLPVFQPLLTGSTFWTRLSSRLSSFTPLGWVSRIRSTGASTDNNSGKSADLTTSTQQRWSFNDLEQNSGKQADLTTSTQQRWSFDDLEQPSSSSENLPWPQATYQGPAYSMNDLPIQGVSHPEMTGIHVQREFGLIRSEAL